MSPQEIQLKLELRRWKRIAVYLADVHAANSFEAEKSHVSKYSLERFISIMDKAAKLLSGERMPDHPLGMLSDEANMSRVLKRLGDNMERLKLLWRKKKGKAK